MVFIISRPNLFNSISVHKFFDINIPDTMVGEVIEKYALRDYNRILERLSAYYPEHSNVR